MGLRGGVILKAMRERCSMRRKWPRNGVLINKLKDLESEHMMDPTNAVDVTKTERTAILHE